MTIIKHTTDLNSPVYQDSLAVRKTVFIDEQHVPIELEVEGEENCTYFVLYNDLQEPQATVRFFPKTDETYKIQRMAVVKEARSKGYGRIIMNALEDFAKKKDIKELVLGAQIQAIPFYESLGYDVYGPSYIEADISHKNMKKKLSK